MKFKTNAKCMGCVSAIRTSLEDLAPASCWEFDLNSPDRIMTYIGENPLDAEIICRKVEAAGFKCVPIE